MDDNPHSAFTFDVAVDLCGWTGFDLGLIQCCFFVGFELRVCHVCPFYGRENMILGLFIKRVRT